MRNAMRKWLLPFMLVVLTVLPGDSIARTGATPWSPESGMQSLVYGSSSQWDVTQAIGRQPDQIVRAEQMYPVVENSYYFDENGSGAATIFVFENGLLVGMHYKSPKNHMVDLTYCLANNGDRRLNWPMLAGYQGYYPYFDMITGSF
jgi:hypothetical protein